MSNVVKSIASIAAAAGVVCSMIAGFSAGAAESPVEENANVAEIKTVSAGELQSYT